MTLLEIVNTLVEEGHQISYRVRSDGGILVTSINGVKYTGASGNTLVRSMAGAELSQARKVQLNRIKPPKKVSPESRKKAKLDDDIRKELLKVQRRIRKRRRETGKNTGTVTTKNVRYTLEHEGRKAALEKLAQANRYAAGLAYDANIDALIGYINELSSKVTTNEDLIALDNLIERINANRGKIKEEDILPTYQILYLINDGVSIRDVVSQVIRQLKI